jgi:hypothetical protein
MNKKFAVINEKTGKIVEKFETSRGAFQFAEGLHEVNGQAYKVRRLYTGRK